MRTLRPCLVAAIALAGATASAADLVPTKTLLVKNPPSGARTALWKVRERASAATVVGDPTADGATLHLMLSPGGDQCFDMPASNWSAVGSIGFKYSDSALSNGPVKVAQIKKTLSGTFLIKAILKNGGATSIAVAPGNPSASYAVNFAIGAGGEYCGGTATAVPNPNNATTFKVSNDGAPAACITSCNVSSTTTSTSSTTTTSIVIIEPCCFGNPFVSFRSVLAPGDCGDVVSATGALTTNLQCSGVYSGGGGNSVPLPFVWPDLQQEVLAIACVAGQLATVGPTTSTETGSNRNCTGVGCLFAAPLPIPNALSTATSTCVVQHVAGTVSGTVDCGTGATSLDVPLGWDVHLTGDTLALVAGIQPCPLCSSNVCVGGPNNGMACVPGTSAINDAYPTSHDCPPTASLSVGTLPIAFALSSGTVSWTATIATNDTETQLNQPRVFSGYCRDVDDTGIFESPAHRCWENGMAVGVACSGTYETCEQRVGGAFGPNGGGNRTITAIGSSTSPFFAPGSATLVALFSIPPTFNPTVDASHDLAGPGAVAIPGALDVCAEANPCP
jgi:hypothetical protein